MDKEIDWLYDPSQGLGVAVSRKAKRILKGRLHIEAHEMKGHIFEDSVFNFTTLHRFTVGK